MPITTFNEIDGEESAEQQDNKEDTARVKRSRQEDTLVDNEDDQKHRQSKRSRTLETIPTFVSPSKEEAEQKEITSEKKNGSIEQSESEAETDEIKDQYDVCCREIRETIDSSSESDELEVRQRKQKEVSKLERVDSCEEYTRTELYSPADIPICFPVDVRIDEFLMTVPTLMDACMNLLAKPPRLLTKDSSERVVYIAQGEVGHSLASECDILVSDKATTCHIVAFRSESKGKLPLTSLTHIDGISYESCVRSMVVEHIIHHQAICDEGKKANEPSATEIFNLEIHIMGGFDDTDSSSLQISSWLMDLLADIAGEEKDAVKIYLKTCAITSMNDNGNERPIGRGLGIDLRSGKVFLAKVEEDANGPEANLRHARLWAVQERELSVVHSSRQKGVTILPFSFGPFPYINRLLRLPDPIFLQKTSTSPLAEEPDFCKSVRSTLRYLRDKNGEEIFGRNINEPLIYQRCGKSNTWKRG
jgi:hypothetical protein